MKTLKSLLAVAAALFLGYAAKATVTVAPTELTWTNGVAVSQSLTATSRTITSPISITWTEDSATSKLPSGVTFSGGSFTGTPTEEGEFDFIVNVALSNTRTGASDAGTAIVKITVVKSESSEEGGTETKTPTIDGDTDEGFEAFVGEENLLEAVVNDATDATVYKWYEVVYDDAGETETEIRGATSTSYNLEYSGGEMVIRLKVFVNSAATEACATKTWYVYEGKGGEEGTWVDFECTSPTMPEDNTYRMSTGESVTFTLSPKDTPPEDAQYVWGSFNTSGSFSVLSSGSLTYTFRASSAGNYNISFYAYTGTAPDFDTGSNLVGNWGCTVEVTAPTPTSVTFTGVSPTMPRTGGSYVTTNGYTTVFEASASTQPEGSSISSVNLAWYRVYEDTAAGTVREQLQDKGGLTYSFYASYCNYEESLDYQIVLVAYTGTEPDFTSSSNILAQYSWNVTEMARPAPSYEFSIEPGSYEWEIGQTQTITVTERNSDGPVTYTWEYCSTGRSLLESGKGDSFSFTVSESGTLRLAVYETTVTVRTNVYWNVTAKSSEGGGGSEGGETSEVTLTPTTLADATVGESYTATISIGGVSSIMGGGCTNSSALPPGLSCRVNTSTMMATVSGTPTTAGTYVFPLYVKIDASTDYTGNITIKVNEAGGGEEGGGDPAVTGYSPTPVVQYWTKTGGNEVLDLNARITMKIGQKTNLTVNVSNADGVTYNWTNPSDQSSLGCTAATYEYTHGGGDKSAKVTVSAGGSTLCIIMWSFDGNEQGDPEEDETTEKDYLPILADSNEAMAIALENRVSLRLGAFSKPIVRKNGAALSGITVQPVGATPGDVSVTTAGVVSGTMTEDLVGETLTLETTWADGLSSYVMTNVLTFAKRTANNTAPYLAGSLPADAAVTAYTGSGNQDTYKVFAYDEEANTLTYKWFFDGEETAYVQNWFTPSSALLGEEGSTHTVACYACESDGAHQEIPLKTWSLTTAAPTFAIIPSTFGADATVGGSAGLLEFRQPDSSSYCLRLDVIAGTLPPGIATFGGTGKNADASAGGIYRKAGTYSFTLRGICSNGETDERDFVITVSGTDSGAKTWSVDSTYDGSGEKGDATTVPSITQALAEGAAADDTIDVVMADGGAEDLSAFRYLKDIGVTLHCSMSFTVGKHIPDLTPFAFESGKGYKLFLNLGSDYALEDDSCGTHARIAKMNADTPYQLDWTLAAPYALGTPAIDEDGYLSFVVGVTSMNETTDLLHIPDVLALRNVVFENATFAKDVKIVADGVLPATIAFRGTTSLAGTFNSIPAFDGSQDAMSMIVESGATVVYAGGTLADSKLGGLVLEPGATLKFAPGDEGQLFSGYRLTMPEAGEAKVRFELTGTRAAASGARTISSRYMGDEDPMNAIEIVPQAGDATNYRVYRGSEQALMFEATAVADPGGIVWTEEDNPSAAQGQLGTPFTFQFKAHGGSSGGASGRGSESEGGEYSSFAYSFTDHAYGWTRDTECTFDATYGARELMQGAYLAGGGDGSAPVDIGFPFPCGTNFIATVNVGPNTVTLGAYTLHLQDKGFLATVTDTLSHLYVIRRSDLFTLRWGEFASVTLTPDGKIRVAFGPAADARDAQDEQVPLYWMSDGSTYGIDFSSSEPYAGSNDVILAPTCPPGLRIEGDSLVGVPLVAGNYAVGVKVVADRAYETNRTFTVAIAEQRFREDRPVINASGTKLRADDDGYVHVQPGATAEFAASVPSGCRMRWTLDGAPTEATDGTCTLTAPAARSLDAAGAKIHRLAVEADDADGRWNWSVRKTWHVVFNRSVYVDASKASSGGATGGSRTGGDGTEGGSSADGSTAEKAFAAFPENLFRYLLNGDTVIVAPGTYAKPIDFGDNTAEATVLSSVEGTRPVIDLTDNAQGYTRCFRQGFYAVEIGKSGAYEVIFEPIAAATVEDFVLKGGAIDSDTHENLQLVYWGSSTNFYGVAGGGAFGGSFANCLFRDCAASDYGGAAYGAALSHCVVQDCTAATGGGCANCTLENCTVVDNVAAKQAGGIDGQCTARSSILYGNTAAGVANDYENTTTPVRLVPYVPTLSGCFTTANGNPAFCADWHLASGSPATGKGAYPEPDAATCLVFAAVEGGGTVTPNELSGTAVALGGSVTFTAGSERTIEAIRVNGVAISEEALAAAVSTRTYTLADVRVNTTVTFAFAPTVLNVGLAYATVGAALAAARSGDTIKVAPGTYEECIDVSGFDGTLVIEAADPDDPPVIDAKGAGRCVTATCGSTDVLFRNMVFVNGSAVNTTGAQLPHVNAYDINQSGYAEYGEADFLAFGQGAGAFGGSFENCTISNCVAAGNAGGGAFRARLVGCTVAGNVAGSKTDANVWSVFGGGAFGGYLENCRVYGNFVRTARSQAEADCLGAGTYDAEVRNSYVWDNFVDCGAGSCAIPSGAANGANGVVIHTEDKAPTEARVAAHKDPIPLTGTTAVYASKQDAEAAAAKQVADISTAVAKVLADQQTYENLFEITSVETAEGSGLYVNKPELKASVQAEIGEQIASVLGIDDSGQRRESIRVQRMEKTLVWTTPGLYYALEFSSDLATFCGERQLATGSGSVKISATSLDTPDGYWRVRVYVTPDGE